MEKSAPLYSMAVWLTLMYSFPLQNEAVPGLGIAEDDQIKLVDWLHINISTVYNITLKQDTTAMLQFITHNKTTIWRVSNYSVQTTSMEQRLSREANSSSSNEEIPRNFRNPNVHYDVHKWPSPISVVSQISTRLCILLLEDPF